MSLGFVYELTAKIHEYVYYNLRYLKNVSVVFHRGSWKCIQSIHNHHLAVSSFLARIMWNIFRRDSAPLLQGDAVDTAVLAGATGIAWAFALELNVTIFLTFRRRSGLYFWSLLACSWGLTIHALAFILNFLVGSPWYVYLPFVEVGWVLMVTGEYSLHTLKGIRELIVFQARR